jgi:hypothetical protein
VVIDQLQGGVAEGIPYPGVAGDAHAELPGRLECGLPGEVRAAQNVDRNLEAEHVAGDAAVQFTKSRNPAEVAHSAAGWQVLP